MGNGYELGRDKECDRDEGVSGNLGLRILKFTWILLGKNDYMGCEYTFDSMYVLSIF